MRFFKPKWSSWVRTAAKCQLFGSYCALCARPGQPGIDLCASCQGALKRIKDTDLQGRATALCPACGVTQRLSLLQQSGLGAAADTDDEDRLSATLANSQIDEFCPECSGTHGQFLRHIVVPYRYAFPVDRMLKRLKYQQERQLARLFGTLLARHIGQQGRLDLPQILLPMPLHVSRQRERGFNQALDIARWCGRGLGIGVQAGSVSRIADTGSLTGLSRVERQHRILGAFRADDALAGQRVAIVDDVLTTGSSSRELAREIYDSGAESVELWVLARTSSTRSGS